MGAFFVESCPFCGHGQMQDIYIYTYIYFIGYYHALFHKLVVNITEAYGLAKRLGKRVLKFFVAACGCLFGVT